LGLYRITTAVCRCARHALAGAAPLRFEELVQALWRATNAGAGPATPLRQLPAREQHLLVTPARGVRHDARARERVHVAEVSPAVRRAQPGCIGHAPRARRLDVVGKSPVCPRNQSCALLHGQSPLAGRSSPLLRCGRARSRDAHVAILAAGSHLTHTWLTSPHAGITAVGGRPHRDAAVTSS
jgi:hypothetical protein